MYLLNDTSNSVFESEELASSCVVNLVQVLACLDEHFASANCALRLSTSPWDYSITWENGDESLGCLVSRLYEDGNTYDLARYFWALQTYSPVDDGLPEYVVDQMLKSSIYPDQDYQDAYLAIKTVEMTAIQCYLTASFLISFRGPLWDFSYVRFLCDDQAANLFHASELSHVGDLLDAQSMIAQRNLNKVNFKETKHTAFRYLRWGRDVDEQVTLFGAKYLSLAFKRLAQLNNIASTWKLAQGRFPYHLIDVHIESTETMARFGSQRRFRAANGDIKTFEEHVWIDGGNRIHFILVDGTQSIEIGYVGVHLDILTEK